MRLKVAYKTRFVSHADLWRVSQAEGVRPVDVGAAFVAHNQAAELT